MRNLTRPWSQWVIPGERLIPVLLIPVPHGGMVAFVDAFNALSPEQAKKAAEKKAIGSVGEHDEGGG